MIFSIFFHTIYNSDYFKDIFKVLQGGFLKHICHSMKVHLGLKILLDKVKLPSFVFCCRDTNTHYR